MLERVYSFLFYTTIVGLGVGLGVGFCALEFAFNGAQELANIAASISAVGFIVAFAGFVALLIIGKKLCG